MAENADASREMVKGWLGENRFGLSSNFILLKETLSDCVITRFSQHAYPVARFFRQDRGSDINLKQATRKHC